MNARFPTLINVSKLKRMFAEAIANKSFGGATVVEDLGRLARGSVKGGSREQRAVAYALASLLANVASDHEDRAVSLAESTEFAQRSEQVFSRAIGFLENPTSAAEAIEIIAALADIDIDTVG